MIILMMCYKWTILCVFIYREGTSHFWSLASKNVVISWLARVPWVTISLSIKIFLFRRTRYNQNYLIEDTCIDLGGESNPEDSVRMDDVGNQSGRRSVSSPCVKGETPLCCELVHLPIAHSRIRPSNRGIQSTSCKPLSAKSPYRRFRNYSNLSWWLGIVSQGEFEDLQWHLL